MLPVIGTILRFSPEEVRAAKAGLVHAHEGIGGALVEQGVGFLGSLLWGGGAGQNQQVISPGRRRSSLGASASSSPVVGGGGTGGVVGEGEGETKRG